MMKTWQLQEANSHFSQLVRDAVNGPQQITVNGKPMVVIITRAEFDQLTNPQPAFLAWIPQS